MRQHWSESSDLWISSMMLRIAVSVLQPFLKPDWCGSSRLMLSMCWVSCWSTHLSRIFERKGRFETGLKLFSSVMSRPGFFSKGVTCPTLRQSGTSLFFKELFMNVHQSGARVLFSFLVRRGGMGSRT